MGTSARKKRPIASPFVNLSTHTPIAQMAGMLKALRPVFENLSTYEATTHFNGQSTVSWAQDFAAGVSYCIAHHVTLDGPRRSLMIASIRYLDHFVKIDGRWYFRQRNLMVDWIDNRPLGAG